jgi:hypothetical protein
MKFEDLSFGTFKEVEPNIMEIIIHEGETLDEEKIAMIEEGLLMKYSEPYCVLVNRIYTYHHTEGSMARVAKFKNAIAFAIVVYNVTGETFAKMHKHFQDNIEVFQEKEKAVAWLRGKLKEGKS